MPRSTTENAYINLFGRKAFLIGCGVALSVGPAFAQTATSTFDVTITIQADCEITSTETLDFGTTGVLTSNVDQAANLQVTCTPDTAYNIGLDVGTGAGATVATRFMTSGANLIGYGLYRDAGRTLIWGDTVGANTQASTGTGSAQTFPVYGRVPPQATPAVGTYDDTVTVTVTF